jgi:hypothetical protein
MHLIPWFNSLHHATSLPKMFADNCLSIEHVSMQDLLEGCYLHAPVSHHMLCAVVSRPLPITAVRLICVAYPRLSCVA